MQYPPLTDEEMAELRKPLAEGVATFTVKNATEGVSNSGNEKITLELSVIDCTGREGTLYDWLPIKKEMLFKLKHFMASIGRGHEWDNGELNVFSLRNATGSCTLKLKESKDPRYGKQIRVTDYIEADDATAVDTKATVTATPRVGPAPAPSDEGMNDDIPF